MWRDASCLTPLSSGGFAIRQSLKGGFEIPAAARRSGSPHGLVDCKSADYPAAGLQIQPNEPIMNYKP